MGNNSETVRVTKKLQECKNVGFPPFYVKSQ